MEYPKNLDCVANLTHRIASRLLVRCWGSIAFTCDDDLLGTDKSDGQES
jgi:hypothetical protein